jgi:hypothetical protein
MKVIKDFITCGVTVLSITLSWTMHNITHPNNHNRYVYLNIVVASTLGWISSFYKILINDC